MKHRQNIELFSMRAVHRSVLVALFLAMIVMAHAGVHAFTFTMDVTGLGGGGIGSYCRLLEGNLTHNIPSGTVPDVHPNALGLSFRPGLADVIDLTVVASWSVAGVENQDAAAEVIYGPYAIDVAHPSRPLSGLVSFSGWAPNSGNAVVCEETVNPVAERSTMFFLGCGLVGLAGLGRKRLVRARTAHRSHLLPSTATGSGVTQR